MKPFFVSGFVRNLSEQNFILRILNGEKTEHLLFQQVCIHSLSDNDAGVRAIF